jgi:hypothetical protein
MSIIIVIVVVQFIAPWMQVKSIIMRTCLIIISLTFTVFCCLQYYYEVKVFVELSCT